VTQPTGLTASIKRTPITSTLQGIATKVYSGTDSITITSPNYNLVGFADGEGASVPQSTESYFGTINTTTLEQDTSITDAGSNLDVSARLSVSDFVPDSGTHFANYILPKYSTG